MVINSKRNYILLAFQGCVFLRLVCEQYRRAWGWWGGHAQNIKDILIALLKCDKYILPLLSVFTMPFMLSQTARAADAKFAFPVVCEYGRDCFIQNFVDMDSGSGYTDYKCNFLAYDKHTGTDIRLRNLKEMQAGVAVLAALDGVVKGVRDGVDDKGGNAQDASVKNRECGNGLVIDHGGGYETQYCHMKKGSIRVQKGDKVRTGSELGEIGLSGMTEFPHLHFEIRMNGKPVDPFSGMEADQGCGTVKQPLWNDKAMKKLVYITTEVLGAGLAPVVPDVKSARAGSLEYTTINADNKVLSFWAEVFGLMKGDIISTTMLAPNGAVLAANEKRLDSSKAVYFQYVGKKYAGGIPAGEYSGALKVKRNGQQLLYRTFRTSVTSIP